MTRRRASVTPSPRSLLAVVAPLGRREDVRERLHERPEQGVILSPADQPGLDRHREELPCGLLRLLLFPENAFLEFLRPERMPSTRLIGGTRSSPELLEECPEVRCVGLSPYDQPQPIGQKTVGVDIEEVLLRGIAENTKDRKDRLPLGECRTLGVDGKRDEVAMLTPVVEPFAPRFIGLFEMHLINIFHGAPRNIRWWITRLYRA